MFTILGARGFIGSRLASSLQKNGVDIFTPERADNEILSRDLGHVIYAIGLTANFRSRPFDTVRAHVSVLTDILDKGNFESFTYLSSTRVYQRSENSTPGSLLLVDPTDPSDLYNLTKLTGESICLNSGKLNTRVVRLSNVIGVGSSNSQNFIDSIIHEALTGKLSLKSAPDSSKDYIKIDDVISILPQIAIHGHQKIYNLAAGKNITHLEWTDQIAAILGCRIDYALNAPSQIFPPINIENLVDEFSFNPGCALDILPALIKQHTTS